MNIFLSHMYLACWIVCTPHTNSRLQLVALLKRGQVDTLTKYRAKSCQCPLKAKTAQYTGGWINNYYRCVYSLRRSKQHRCPWQTKTKPPMPTMNKTKDGVGCNLRQWTVASSNITTIQQFSSGAPCLRWPLVHPPIVLAISCHGSGLSLTLCCLFQVSLVTKIHRDKILTVICIIYTSTNGTVYRRGTISDIALINIWWIIEYICGNASR